MRKKTKDEKYIEILDNLKKKKSVKKRMPRGWRVLKGGKQ
jgi:hypothetical protein